MKKTKLTLLGVCLLITISACQNNNSSSPLSSSTTSINTSSIVSTSSSSSSSTIEIITGIEIAGPTSVLVGKTIRLTADVLGSTNDDVTWSSNNISIATVTENGEVKGLSEGEVYITATSVKDPTKSSFYVINVNLPKADGISLFIEESENVTYDSALDKYSVNLGQTFYIDINYYPENNRTPNITYTLIYPDGTEYNSLITIEMEPDSSRAKVISFQAFEGLVIKATGKYNDYTGQDLISTIELDVIDKNLEKYTEVQNTISTFKDAEQQSLVSSSIKRIKTTSDGVNEIKVEHNIEHQSYLNATYVDKNVKKYTNDSLDSEVTTHYYQGIDTSNFNTHYYTFEYDENDNIVNLFDSSKNLGDVSLFFDIYSSTTYGYTNILNNIVSSSTNLYEGDIASFGNSYIYAYADFEITSNSIKVSSTCYDDDYDINYTVYLEINFIQNKLNNYKFTETIDNGSTTIEFIEEANDFVYSTKVNDSVDANNTYLDLNQYYLEDYEICLFNGKDNGSYDYSDRTKYDAVEGLENGLTKYTTTYDKTIILKVNALEPSTADVNFDNVEAVSSDPNQVPNVSSIKDGIFAINAKKDDNGNSLPGKATFTFTSRKGIQKQVVIEFAKTILKDVNVSFGSESPTYNKDKETYVFNPIFVGETSSYFYINTDPDENGYVFNIDIIEGSENGIELFQYSDDNIYGYPGFSFALKGNILGTYKFQITVDGYESIRDERTFEIAVEEPYSSEYIAENIIGQSYAYQGSVSTYTFTYTDETTITYTEEYGYGGSASTTFKYHIEQGAIIIDSTQTFKSGMYFSRISEGSVLFSKDFKMMKFYVEIYDENKAADKNVFTYNLTFNKVNKPISIENLEEHLNGKTLANEDNTISVTFNNGKGTLNFYSYSGNLNATFTFDYAYDSESNTLIFSNSTSSNSLYSLIESSCSFDSYNQLLEFRIQTNSQYGAYSDTYKVAIQ